MGLTSKTKHKAELGIYIPTHNRPTELERCLKVFIPQLRPYKFPIYISDGSSLKDNRTKDLIEALKKEYHEIHYKRNNYMKYGKTYATNLKCVLEMGDTNFAWIFGDDDLIKDGSISTILSKIKKGYEFLVVNSETWDINILKKIHDRFLLVYKDITYLPSEHEKVMLDMSKNALARGYIGYMGSIITKLDQIKYELNKIDNRSLSGLDFLHSTLLFRSIVGKKGILIANPLICGRSGIGLTGRECEVWLGSYADMLDTLRDCYSNATLKSGWDTDMRMLLFTVLISKRENPNIKTTKTTCQKLISKNRYMNLLSKIILMGVIQFAPKNTLDIAKILVKRLVMEKRYIKRLLYRTVTLNGYKMKVDKFDTHDIITKKTFEPEETKIIKQFLSSNKNLVGLDLGANIGYYTLLMAKYCDKVYAFEPEKNNYDILSKNILMNKYINIIAENKAVGDKQKEGFLNIAMEAGSHSFLDSIKSRKVEKVRIVKLDNYFDKVSEKPNIIKIDIEGYELEALRGARNLLKNVRAILIEYNVGLMKENGRDPIELFNFIKDNGFKIEQIINYKLEKVSGASDIRSFNLWCTK